MKWHILLVIFVATVTLFVSGCCGTSGSTNEENARFAVGKVTITEELQMKEFWTDETTILHAKDGTKFVIVPLTITNKNNKWLYVGPLQEGTGEYLEDQEGNKYAPQITFIEGKEGIYSFSQSKDLNETDWYIAPSSTEEVKFVFVIAKYAQPKTLRIMYGTTPVQDSTIISDISYKELDLS